MKNRHLTEEERQEIVALYQDLKHTRLVMERTGHSYSRVHTTLRRAGIRPEGGRVGVCRRRREEIAEWCKQGLSMMEMQRRLGTNHKTLARHLEREGIELEPFRPVGPNNPAWAGGRNRDKHGYILIWKPDHPQATKAGYVREHRLVMEEKLGRYLTRAEVVDHIDRDTGNNDPANLRLFPNNAAHLKATLTGVKCPQRGRPGVPRPRKAKRSTPSPSE